MQQVRRQTDRQTYRQTDRQTDMCIDIVCRCQTCVLAEGALNVGRGVSNIGLPKGCHKIMSDLQLAGLLAASLSCALFHRPFLQVLRSHALVVSADEIIGVVDGSAMNREPADGTSACMQHMHRLDSYLAAYILQMTGNLLIAAVPILRDAKRYKKIRRDTKYARHVQT